MKIAAIITEYNPFHNGHEYQINKTRELLGPDTAIIAIMSGNYTQRGELAFADKTVRAEAAVRCGVNLVLELPFPYSMSSAEFFAKSGVKIASELGIVDYLVFGSECGDVDNLCEIAENMLSEKFADELILREKEESNLGHAALCERVYREMYGKKLSAGFLTPNNILAIEYIKAIRSLNSPIIPLTIKREGADYLSSYTDGTKLQSASAIRSMMYSDLTSAFDYVPKNAKSVFLEAINSGSAPTFTESLDTAIISHFRLNSPAADCDIHDAGGGLYNRLCQMSLTATTFSSLVSMTETKKYTTARIRRAIWNSYFGVTSSVVRALPKFTQVLAMDGVGRSLLKKVKKMSDFPIFTKPSSYRSESHEVVMQKELSNKADAVFDLTRKKPISATFALTFTPYVKE